MKKLRDLLHYTILFPIFTVLITVKDLFKINYKTDSMQKSNFFQKMDVGLMNLINKRSVLELLRTSGKINRSEISKLTGLTPPTVTKIIKELISFNLCGYSGPATSSGGRPSVVVEFKSSENLIIGIDLGATYIRGCLVDLEAKFLSEIQVPTEIESGLESILEKLVETISKLSARTKPNQKIWGVGIGVAGFINHETGIVEISPDFDWKNVDLKELMKDRIPFPFFYDNSTRLMAKGEKELGRYKNESNFAVINVGYGIAAGLVVNDLLLYGNKGFTGELGHIQLRPDSKIKCACGKYGCLEALASGKRIAEMGRERLNPSRIKDLIGSNKDNITAKVVFRAALAGDQDAQQICYEIADYLAIGIGIISNLLNPSKIFIGGGVALSGDYLFELINEKKDKYLIDQNNDLEILPTTHGEFATAIGSVSLVLERLMKLDGALMPSD